MITPKQLHLLQRITARAKDGVAENLSAIVDRCDYNHEYTRLAKLELYGMVTIEHFGHGRKMRIHILQRQLTLLNLEVTCD